MKAAHFALGVLVLAGCSATVPILPADPLSSTAPAAFTSFPPCGQYLAPGVPCVQTPTPYPTASTATPTPFYRPTPYPTPVETPTPQIVYVPVVNPGPVEARLQPAAAISPIVMPPAICASLRAGWNLTESKNTLAYKNKFDLVQAQAISWSEYMSTANAAGCDIKPTAPPPTPIPVRTATSNAPNP